MSQVSAPVGFPVRLHPCEPALDWNKVIERDIQVFMEQVEPIPIQRNRMI